MERERVRIEPSPTRCPFCHEQVGLDERAWVACAACLGRHHSGCWDESGSCASCHHPERLLESSRVEEPEPDSRQRDLLRLLDAEDRKAVAPSPLEWLFSPLTAFLTPLFMAEARFRQHLRDSRPDFASGTSQDPAVEERLVRYRSEALDGSEQGSLRRTWGFGLAFTAWALAILAGVLCLVFQPFGYWYQSYTGSLTWNGGDSKDVAAVLIVVASIGWFISLHLAVWLHRRAVARHEQRQLAHHALAVGADPHELRYELDAHQRAWTELGSLPAGFRLLAGFLGSPLLFPRLFGSALALHTRREASSPLLQPPKPRK